MSTQAALRKIAAVLKKYDPASPFEYKFNDDEYAKKFSGEQQTGRLATVFAVLAIFISCLGLFGMASFMAEQRIKEIGVRKVLGATVFSLWKMLSKDFCGAGNYFVAYCCAGILLLYASMVAGLSIPNRHYLVDICCSCSRRNGYYLSYSKLSKY